MWIASKYGYFSIVKKDGGWHIRARSKEDLELLRTAVGGDFVHLVVHLTPEADYCSRIFVEDDPEGKKLMEALFSTLEASIDYPNFKDEVGMPIRLTPNATICSILVYWHKFSVSQRTPFSVRRSFPQVTT